MREPLSLPETFDPAWNMPFVETDTGRFHVTREASRLARQLVTNGTDKDMETAEAVLSALLAYQETRIDHPHRGNFPWMAEDREVEDLNAVEFILQNLISLMIDHGDRVKEWSSKLHEDLIAAITIGLEEIVRLDVHIGYTNITLLDILNTTLGGELLGVPALLQRGRYRLQKWSEYTLQNGHILEFNSPTYTPVTLNALAQIVATTTQDDIRTIASGMVNRIALSAALRFHAASGRWAGPHGRGYVDTLNVAPHRREIQLREALERGSLRSLKGLLPSPEGMWELREWASRERGLGMITYLSRNFTLGTAYEQLMSQSNVLIGYIAEPKQPGTARNTIFSRFLTNDQWFGDYYHQTDRSRSRNLLEEGLFAGIQRKNISLGAYAPAKLEHISQAAVVVVIAQADHVDELVIGGTPVSSLPVEFSDHETVGFRSGDTYGALRCIHRDKLTSPVPCTLRQRGHALVIEYPLYKGAEKSFWEMCKMGGFFKGHPAVVLALSLGEAEDADSTVSFAAHLAELPVSSHRGDQVPFDGTNTQPWTMKIGDLSLTIDQYRWKRIPDEFDSKELLPEVRALYRSVKSGQKSLAAEARGYPVTVQSVTAHFPLGHVWLVCAEQEEHWMCGWVQSEGKADTLTVSIGDRLFSVAETSSGLLMVHQGTVYGSVGIVGSLRLPNGYLWGGLIGDLWLWV